MKKIVLSLAAVALSFGMAANAQMQGGQGLGENNVEKPLIQKQAQNAGNMAYPRLSTTSEAVKEAVKKMQEERSAFKVRVEASKKEAQENRIQAKEALKTKLQGIKDEKKKAAVQRLEDNMSKLNSNFIEKWTKNLTNFDDYLAKLVEKANTFTGKDLTAFNNAIESAKASIVSARTALEAQAKKVYAITVSTEENLKLDVSSVREMLNNDLKIVKDLVQAAHSETVNALTEFNKVK